MKQIFLFNLFLYFRIYDSPFRDEGLYDTGYRAPPGSTYYVSGAPTPGLPDLPSPDSGIGQDQVNNFCLKFLLLSIRHRNLL